MKNTFPISVLDLAILKEGFDARDAYERSLDLARNVEKWGFSRFWLAEHHNMPYVGSSSPTLLMGYIAQGTKSIRVGSGGIMLPNHSPLIVAEQIGVLETLYPGRIDLGLGRAPGTDQKTAAVLRRGRVETVQEFPKDLVELQQYFSKSNFDKTVRAFPAEGLDIPFYILGSSMSSAALAAERGLPYVFASHFAPTYFLQAIRYYKANFRPSSKGQKPYIISCVNVIASDSDEKAQRLATSFYQMALGIVRSKSYPLRPPVKSMQGIWSPAEAAAIQNMMACTFIGTKESIQQELEDFIQETQVDEIMVTTNIYDHEDRLRSFELTAEIFQKIKITAELVPRAK
ncbi:LLM class flavin-dependent oxidoreductase [Litoribacter populi]|uniref:LLM class flavin-dependent oxidoreductase n=1 Tax=Litoribacter populi TaxID=2598460 RepID=UPI00117FC922|nr:LLM class flavin-dependent oxidoreductase [Litoribacter populi]